MQSLQQHLGSMTLMIPIWQMRKTRPLEVRRWGLIPKPPSGQGEPSVSVAGVISWELSAPGPPGVMAAHTSYQALFWECSRYWFMQSPQASWDVKLHCPPCSRWRTSHRWLCYTTWTEWFGTLSKVTQLVSVRVGFEPRVDVFYPFNEEQLENWQAATLGEMSVSVVLHSWHTCTPGGLVQ